MKKLFLTLPSVLLVAACTNSPNPVGDVNAMIDGRVYLTGPVAGVIVTAKRLDVTTGAIGEDLAAAAATDATGAFHLELGNAEGPIVLVARGASASYVEPASGISAAWDISTELRAAYLELTAGQDLSFYLPLGAHVTDFVISPWSELAFTYAEARQAAPDRFFDADFRASLRQSHSLVAAHLEHIFWSTLPVDLTAGPAAGWNDGALAGVELAGFSMLVRRMADASSISPAGLTSLRLLAALGKDLRDPVAQLDGLAGQTPLIVGTCDGICHLDGATLRANFAEAIAEFLASTANTSGIGVTDAEGLLTRISGRQSELFPDGGSTGFDTVSPTITVEGLSDGDILVGDVAATITISDAVRMSDDVTVTFIRNDAPLEVPSPFYEYSVAAPDARTRVVTLGIHSAALTDGPITFQVEATDAAANPANLEYPLYLDNTPLGSISGAVVVGGAVEGARVRVYEWEGHLKGALLGEATTDAEGRYFMEAVAETTQTALLLEADTDPGSATPAHYVDAATGVSLVFSTSDVVRSALTGWTDGAIRTDGVISPWTHIAVAFAEAVHEDYLSSVPAAWPVALENAFDVLEAHFHEGGFAVNFRAVRPADLTSVDGTTTLNEQVRYGIAITALSQLAQGHAQASGATVASVNAWTLTKVLATDIADGCDGHAGVSCLDGRSGSGQLTHGTISLDSYATRVDLAIASVAFLEDNPRNATPFVELDVALILDVISTDDGDRGPALPRVYPASHEPIPYDVLAPAPVSFVTPTPTDGTVLRGTVPLRVEAFDNRALDAVVWLDPTSAIGDSLLDTTSGLPGPWYLSGSLLTDTLPEGPVTVIAQAVDEASRTTEVTRTVVVDRTDPAVSIVGGTTATGVSVAPAGWTGAATLTVAGTATDLHFASATYTWNGATAALSVAADGSWSVTVDLLAGPNTVDVTAHDLAGNSTTASATFYRDALPPTVVVVQSSVADEATLLASVSGSGVGVVTYTGPTTEVDLVPAPTPSFTKYSTKYSPSDDNLPEWRFNVTDDHSAADAITLTARVSRQAVDGSWTLLTGWLPVPALAGVGYNRQQTISTALDPSIAIYGGTYQLEYQATDELGNTSAIAAVSWTQSILPPPVRQRAGAACLSTDFQCAEHYGLEALKNNALIPIQGDVTLPDNKLKVANGYIDNPNALPVVVKVNPVVSTTWSFGHVIRNPHVMYYGPYYFTCHTADSTLTGACYTRKSTAEQTRSSSSPIVLPYTLEVRTTGGTVLSVCPGCAPREYEIPPASTVAVWVLTDPYAFLVPTSVFPSVADLASVGTGPHPSHTPTLDPLVEAVTDVTGIIENDWADCEANGCTSMDYQIRRREVHFYSRISVTPSTSVSLKARPAASYTYPQDARGTNVSSFAYAPSNWSTTETGF